MDTIFNNNAFSFLFILIIVFVAALVCALAVFITGFTKKKNSLEVLRINMIIKLIHVPAYLLIFVFGLLCTLTIFTIGINIVLIIFDGMTIILSGLIGIGGIIRGLRENKISIKKAVLHGMLQFVYCADIISSIVIYRTVKATEKDTFL
jgi:hypothetical protein